MKLRSKKDHSLAYSGDFNTMSMFEIIVHYEDGDASSDYPSDYDVWLESKQEWKDLKQAFRDHDVITDNFNSIFFEPSNEEDRKRGFTL